MRIQTAFPERLNSHESSYERLNSLSYDRLNSHESTYDWLNSHESSDDGSMPSDALPPDLLLPPRVLSTLPPAELEVFP